MQKDPANIEEAKKEIQVLNRVLSIGGRIFCCILITIALIGISRARMDDDTQLIICISLGVLDLLFAFGIIKIDLPGRFGRPFEERKKYLEGFIKGRENNS